MRSAEIYILFFIPISEDFFLIFIVRPVPQQFNNFLTVLE